MEDYIQKLLDTNGEKCLKSNCDGCELMEFYHRRKTKERPVDCYEISADKMLELIRDYLVFKKMLII